jgi:hypothetical protein
VNVTFTQFQTINTMNPVGIVAPTTTVPQPVRTFGDVGSMYDVFQETKF